MILRFYILRRHLAPFIFANVTLTFLLILQFLMKYADRLIGKGIDGLVVAQLIALNLAWMMVLVVPMATLVATLMAFGGLSQDNEITIAKTAGMSIYKMALFPVLASLVVFYGLVRFTNDVLPDANHKAKLLMHDISQKKPTLSLVPGQFSQEMEGYAILARGIDQTTNLLSNVAIYDYRNPNDVRMVTAREGKLYFTKDRTKLIMDLTDGEIHDPDVNPAGLYRRVRFERHRISMNAEQFSLQQTATGQRGDRELSASDMRRRVDSLQTLAKDHLEYFSGVTARYLYGDSLASPIPPNTGERLDMARVYQHTIDRVKGVRNTVVSARAKLDFAQKEINKYLVEIHKKYSLPFACVVFTLIGAPLGVMTRKGGFGMAASISLFFFLIYWAFLIGGEKLADRGMADPFWGMWSANALLAAFGALLFYKSSRDNTTIEFSFFKRLVPKRFRQPDGEERHEDS
ncbi:MAG: LptF/LptG family permease [Ignavibacteriales bacterium]|nr:LptF/LptG family permease [Ignavibacteriales bacterium]